MIGTVLAHEAATGSGLPETAVLVAGGVGVCVLYLTGTRRLVRGPRERAGRRAWGSWAWGSWAWGSWARGSWARGSWAWGSWAWGSWAWGSWAWGSWAWRRWMFCGGVAVVVLALLPVIDPVVDESFPLHMVQHMVLVLVAAPLLALGAPGLPLLLALPHGWRRRVAAVRAAPSVRRTRAVLAAPLLGIAGYGVIVLGWHLPAIYDAALESAPIHVAEHACFLLGGWLLWLPITTPSQILDGGRAVLYVFLSGFPMSLVGVILTLAPRPLYPAQTGTGPGALHAQQLAGVLMWIPSGMVTLGICGLLLLAWFSRMERSDPGDSALPAPTPPPLPVPAPRPTGTGRKTLPGSLGRKMLTSHNGEVPR